MPFELSEEQRLIQKTARDFAASPLSPFATHWDEDEAFPIPTCKNGEIAALTEPRLVDEAVREGCGNCVPPGYASIVPVDTKYGRKRAINQSSP